MEITPPLRRDDEGHLSDWRDNFARQSTDHRRDPCPGIPPMRIGRTIGGGASEAAGLHFSAAWFRLGGAMRIKKATRKLAMRHFASGNRTNLGTRSR